VTTLTIHDGPILLDSAAGVFEPPDDVDLAVFCPGGSRPPLVLVRTWTDELERHRRLASVLGPDQPVFSVAAPGPAEELPRTAAAWAEAVAPLVLDRLPPGPVATGGWSFGGVVGLELADLLANRGHPVVAVVLLDGSLPRTHERTRAGAFHESLRRVVRILDLHPSGPQRRARLRSAAGNAPHTWWRWSKRRARHLRARLRPTTEAPATYDRTAMTPRKRAIWTAYLKYRARPTEHHLHVLWTEGSRQASGSDSSLGWARALTTSMELTPVSGDHYTMFDDEHLDALGTAVRRGLDRVDQVAGSRRSLKP
jgi:thioesterase domain-containing protein